MAFKCKLGLHSWNGCKCSECGKIRDELHNWFPDQEQCSGCGKKKDMDLQESYPTNAPSEKENVPVYFEKDNIGTRILTADRNQAAYNAWLANGSPPCGSIYYGFNSEKEAYAAMTGIPCMKIASDSNKLICLEIIEFGVYWDSLNEKYWEAFLQGPSLTLSTFRAAEQSFVKHKGVRLISVEPESKIPRQASVAKNEVHDISSVKFVRNSNVIMMGITGTKEIYKAPDKVVAIEFLKTRTVTKKYYFIEIETPEGWVGKDIDGVYET
jgi:hypothetical protein